MFYINMQLTPPILDRNSEAIHRQIEFNE